MSNQPARYAILVDKKVTPVEDVLEWAKWFEENYYSRKVAATTIGDVQISTVFLGVNHAFAEEMMGIDNGLWFETMIFGGEHDGWMNRYTTYEQAEEGHQKAVALVKGEGNGNL